MNTGLIIGIAVIIVIVVGAILWSRWRSPDVPSTAPGLPPATPILAPADSAIQPSYDYTTLAGYNVFANTSPSGDYKSSADQSTSREGTTCCTRIAITNKDLTPAFIACAADANCRGIAYNGSNWATLKNSSSIMPWNGLTAYIKK